MLMQSRICYDNEQREVEIKILPALPKSWTSGSIKGLRTKGNLEIDFEWKDRKVISPIIRNKGTEEVHVKIFHDGKKLDLVLKPE